MIDSHCHIDLPAFDHDRSDVLERAARNGVTRILVPGLSIEQVRRLLLLKAKFPMLDIAAGFHPFFLTEMSQQLWQSCLETMSHWIDTNLDEIVGIGEFGLDNTLSLSKTFQEQVFVDQLLLAQQVKKPVILHHRQSHNDIIRLLKQQKFQQGGVIHAFSGSVQVAQTYLDMGFKLGVGGTITYPRGEKTRNTLKQVPLSAVLLETDAPDMPLYGYQGARNTPERLGLVAQALADVKDISLDELVKVTSQNYMSLFSSISAP